MISHRACACCADARSRADIEADSPPGEVKFVSSKLSLARQAGLRRLRLAAHGIVLGAQQGESPGSKPEAVYELSPFGLAAAELWPSGRQEARLRERAEAKLTAMHRSAREAGETFLGIAALQGLK